MSTLAWIVKREALPHRGCCGGCQQAVQNDQATGPVSHRLGQVGRLCNFPKLPSLTEHSVKGNENSERRQGHTLPWQGCSRLTVECATVSSEISDSLFHINPKYYCCLLKFNASYAQGQQLKLYLYGQMCT